MSYSFSLSGKGIHISITDLQQNEIVSFWSTDNQNLRKYNNLPDQNPESTHITVSLPSIYLPEGEYQLSTTEQSSPIRFESKQPTRTLLVQTPTEATGVEAWQSNTGYAWAPAQNGFAQLPLGSGSWEIHAQGTQTAFRAISNAHQQAIALTSAPSALPRIAKHINPWLLLPGWLAFCLLCLFFFRPKKSWLWGIFCGCLILPFLMGEALRQPSSVMLQAAESITDPIDSLALVSTINPFSPHTEQFQYPEGDSWLRLGPAWVGYLPAVILHFFSTSLWAHNMGLMIWWVILGGTLYTLARCMGTKMIGSILYVCCAVLSPILVDEADSLSLDRATLFIFPLTILCFHHAWTTPSRSHALKAAVSLGASIHVQLYYSLYFVLLLPFLTISYCIQKKSWYPIRTLIKISPLALLLAFPALWVLQEGAMGSYSIDTLPFPEPSAIDSTAAERFLNSPDHSLPTNTPKQRLLSTVKGSISFQNVLLMSVFWLPGLVICAIRTRHARPLCIAIIILLIFSLGPIWISNGEWSGVALPYYYVMKWLPGFDQLKNVYRFALLASLLLPLPLFILLRTRWALMCSILYFFITPLPMQYTHRQPVHRALSTLTEGATCFLPLGTHSPNWMVKDAAQHNLKIINPPSFEQGSDTLTPIYLDHPLLNRIALLSGHSEIDVLHLAEIDKEDIIALQKNDIRWFVLPKRQLFLEKKIKALLDQHLSRWSEDDRYLVWTIPASL